MQATPLMQALPCWPSLLRTWALGAALAFAACATDAPPPDAGPTAGDAGPQEVELRLLAFNDFHGALDPTPATDGGLSSGGAALLAAHVEALRTPTTLVVSAGDLIGASPFTSGWFHDEPTIEVMNALGLDFSAVGNHELDEGPAELLRLQHGGCHPVDGCVTGRAFEGAHFQFLGGNVLSRDGGAPVFPGWAVREVGALTVGIVGVTLRTAAALLPPAATAELTFGDEVEAIRGALPALEAAGADLVVALLHEGGTTVEGASACATLSGRVVAIAQALQGQVAAIVSGHTHATYACPVGNVLVTSAGAKGMKLTQLDLRVDVANRAVLSAAAQTVSATSVLAPHPAVAAIVDGWSARAAAAKDTVVGSVQADIPQVANAAGESPVADAVTDGMLAGTRGPPWNAVAALLNRGNVRAPLRHARSGAEPEDGQVTLGEAYAVLPFANEVFTVSVSGRALAAALDDWADGARPPLQVAGLSYTRHLFAEAGSRVTVADVILDGAPLEADRTYRVTVNAIVGSVTSTPSMALAADETPAGVDLELFLAHLAASSPLGPPVGGRLRVEP